eukprot:TRINITY_DN25863_c0_g1_i1.p1 TRINITY_DN25863_c0_g1~~TRINITY_DN25863_c0_g1_i1.p1  ORF type:complete len:694 (-),score=123.53 TRINITY_DN25863_c0_g1_i1:39-2072(-)
MATTSCGGDEAAGDAEVLGASSPAAVQPEDCRGAAQGTHDASPAITWLELRKGSQLEISPQAQSIFQGANGYVNPVMICGRLRIGKSYLMNALLGRNCFGVSGQARSFTKGINIAPELVAGSAFGAPADSPSVALLDLEGQGDKGLAQDVKLATPLLLVSKVVLLLELCPTGPSKESILESLQVMMRAAEHVSERQHRKSVFGSLHIILRDCSQDEAECHEIIFGLENENDADTDEHAKAIARRNEVRNAIGLAFEATPKVWCMPKLPTCDAPADYRKASPDFVAKVEEMRAVLGRQLSGPKLLDSKPLTGTMIADLMPAVADVLRSSAPALNPPSLMERITEAEVRRALEEAHATATCRFDSLRRSLPMEVSRLQREMEDLKQALKSELDNRLLRAGADPRPHGPQLAAFSERLELLRERTLRYNLEQLQCFAKEKELELLQSIRGSKFTFKPQARYDTIRESVETTLAKIDRELDLGLEMLPLPLAHLLRERITVEKHVVELEIMEKCREVAHKEAMDEASNAHSKALQDANNSHATALARASEAQLSALDLQRRRSCKLCVGALVALPLFALVLFEMFAAIGAIQLPVTAARAPAGSVDRPLQYICSTIVREPAAAFRTHDLEQESDRLEDDDDDGVLPAGSLSQVDAEDGTRFTIYGFGGVMAVLGALKLVPH